MIEYEFDNYMKMSDIEIVKLFASYGISGRERLEDEIRCSRIPEYKGRYLLVMLDALQRRS